MKRLFATLAVSLLLVLGTNMPAFANPVNGCPDNDVCFWNWESYDPGGSGYWFAQSEITGNADHCIDLYFKLQWDGRGANNRATSLVVNTHLGAHDLIVFYDWTNCNPGGGGFSVDADTYISVPRLVASPWGNWNDAIGSVYYCQGCKP